MSNPWLEIPLEEYEAHMSSASVGQAQYLADALEELVLTHSPKSIAVIGCSGGNGFDRIPPATVERVVGVDINPEYIAKTRGRFTGRFNQFELLCEDVLSPMCTFPPVDLVFAGLLFEYVDCGPGLASIRDLVRPEGHLSVVLQLPSETTAAVSPSPYVSLRKLEPILTFISPNIFSDYAGTLGLTVQRSRRTVLKSGKAFHEFLFQASASFRSH